MNHDEIRQAHKKIKFWNKNILEFVKDNFGVDPDIWQKEALLAFQSGDREKIRIALQACAGVGKSAVMAWCILWFISTNCAPGEHPKGVAVSVSWDNLKDNLWPEVNKWLNRSPYLSFAFAWTKERLYAKDHPETWFVSARSFSQTANREELGKTLSGVHGKYVAFFIDESGAIPIEVAKACEQAVGEALGSGGFIKILQAGNPLTTDGMLYSASMSKNTYVVRITGDPDDPKRSSRIDKQWAQEQIDELGRDNPWVMAYILGLFPNSAINSLLSINEVMDAMERFYSEDQIKHYQKRLGVDVAREGLDNTVIFPRQGKVAFKPVVLSGADSPTVAARVVNAKNKWGSEIEFIDSTGGYGGGVIDFMRQGGHNPIGINFSSSASNIQYEGKRSEMWFEMAKWVKEGGALPKIEALRKELTTPTYTFHKGKFLLESKKQYKKRLGGSPDHADALALTFAHPEVILSEADRYRVKTQGSRMRTSKDAQRF